METNERAPQSYVIFISKGTTGPANGVEVEIRRVSNQIVAFKGTAPVSGVNPPEFKLENNTTYTLKIASTSGTVRSLHVQAGSNISGSNLNWEFTTGSGSGYIQIYYN